MKKMGKKFSCGIKSELLNKGNCKGNGNGSGNAFKFFSEKKSVSWLIGFPVFARIL
jgi:hypothetical protein